MEKKIIDMLDNLSIEEVDELLNEDLIINISKNTRNRIEKSVMKKIGVCNKDTNYLKRLRSFIGKLYIKRKLITSLAMLIFIIAILTGTYVYAKTPIAYVNLDINPSVELGINAFDKVVSYEDYDDGNEILKSNEIKNIPLEKAINTIIKSALDEGYISNDGSSVIGITAVTSSEDEGGKIEASIKDITKNTLKENNTDAAVEFSKVSIERRDEARKLGITPGKLNLIQNLQTLDPAITVEEYKDISVKEIQLKTKELKEDDKKSSNNSNSNSNSNSGNKNNNVIDNKTNNPTSNNNKLSSDSNKVNDEKSNNLNNSKDKSDKKPLN